MLGLNSGFNPPTGALRGPRGSRPVPSPPWPFVLRLFHIHYLASTTAAGVEAPRSPVCGWEKDEPEKLPLCSQPAQVARGAIRPLLGDGPNESALNAVTCVIPLTRMNAGSAGGESCGLKDLLTEKMVLSQGAKRAASRGSSACPPQKASSIRMGSQGVTLFCEVLQDLWEV